ATISFWDGNKNQAKVKGPRGGRSSWLNPEACVYECQYVAEENHSSQGTGGSVASDPCIWRRCHSLCPLFESQSLCSSLFSAFNFLPVEQGDLYSVKRRFRPTWRVKVSIVGAS
ncbi:hypothetical protein CARUB_v10024289mg, partial [Capsella rubella]